MAKQIPQAGLVSLMEYLDDHGIRKGFCTRNFDTPVNHLLANHIPGHINPFSPVITRDFRPPKPSPAGILHIAHSWDVTDTAQVESPPVTTVVIQQNPSLFNHYDAATFRAAAAKFPTPYGRYGTAKVHIIGHWAPDPDKHRRDPAEPAEPTEPAKKKPRYEPAELAEKEPEILRPRSMWDESNASIWVLMQILPRWKERGYEQRDEANQP